MRSDEAFASAMRALTPVLTRDELAQHPAMALIALVYWLVLATFFEGSQGSCLEITRKTARLSGHAPGIDESIAEQQAAERHAAWGKRLPSKPKVLRIFIHWLSDDERMSLHAHCVSLTANAIRAPRQCADESEAHAAVLAREVGLDMTSYWQPTAANYSGRVGDPRAPDDDRRARDRAHCMHPRPTADQLLRAALFRAVRSSRL